MKKQVLYLIAIFCLSIFQLSGQTLTQKLYFDFGKSNVTNGNQTTSPDINGNYWNNIVSTEAGSPSTKPAGYTVNLINSTNQPTDYVLETTRKFSANGGDKGGLLAPNPDLLGDLAIGSATEDYFFIDNGINDKGAFVIKNLDPTKAYKFYVYGCREEAAIRTSIYSISGINGSHSAHQTSGAGIGTEKVNANDNNIFESDFIVPKANGEILFEMGILNGGFAYISAMKIEEYSGYTLPAAEKKFYIDFGKNNSGLDGSPTANPDVNSNYWNNMYSNGDGPSTEQAGKAIDIVYSDNSETDYSLELGSKVEFNGVRNGALTNPNPDYLGDLAIATATHDYLFISSGSAKIHLKNLKTDKMYRFYIFGSREEKTSNRIERLEIAGSKSITGIHQAGGKDMDGVGVFQNYRNIFISDPIVPDSEGTITITLGQWLGYAHINVMKVEELPVNERATAITVTGNDITSGGQIMQMNFTATPANAYCPPVEWSVDDEETALITTTGKLYPKKNGTVTVTATATFDPENSISGSKVITITNQNISDYSLTVMGSSVPNGQGADANKGYAHLLSQWLAQNAENTWTTANISIGGNTTTNVLDRWDRDLMPTCSRYVYYGLSLGNEGVHDRGEAAFNSYRDNMQILIERTRSVGKIPLAGNNYPRADFNAADYNYLKKMNLLMHEWDIPTVNLLGAIDNGAGQWATGFQADGAHPNTAGHAELFYAFVPSLFDALADGKPQPVKVENTSLTLEKTDKVKRIAWVPEGTTHSFTLSFSFKTTSTGVIASFATKSQASANLQINSEGKLVYARTISLDKLTSPTAVNDGEWHHVSLTHYYAWGRTFLYVDGVQVTGANITEKLVPVQFYLNDFNDASQSIAYRELFFHRAGMCAEEIQALKQGKMLKSSLEIYAPLDGSATGEDILKNTAQSLNTLMLEQETPPTNSLKEIAEDMLKKDDIKEVAIYTIAGKKVLEIQNGPFDSFNGLPPGIYIARILSKSGNVSAQKIIIE